MNTKTEIRRLVWFAMMAAGSFALSGCASSVKRPDAEPQFYFNQSLENVRTAAVHAATVLGFQLTKQEATVIEGVRPRKIGLVVGSGGETIRIWLTPAGAQRTGVTVKTDKTFVGGAGQRNWDDEIVAEMRGELGGAAP